MRHLGSVVLVPAAALLALALAGRGLAGLADATEAARGDYFAVTASASALGLAGLTYALLTMARLSPLGPGLAGAGYLAVGIWALADPAGFRDAVPAAAVRITDEQLAAAATVAPLLAVPLLVTLFLPGRWRGPDRPDPTPGAITYGRPAGPPTNTLDDIPAVPPPPPPSSPRPLPGPPRPSAPDETTVRLPPGNP